MRDNAREASIRCYTPVKIVSIASPVIALNF